MDCCGEYGLNAADGAIVVGGARTVHDRIGERRHVAAWYKVEAARLGRRVDVRRKVM